MDTLIGQGLVALEMIVDPGSFQRDRVGAKEFTDESYGPGAVVGTATLDGQTVTVIASDAEAFNEKFPVVYAGIIGMEEGYKMASAVYATLAADVDKPAAQKRPLVLIVDTPGNGPGKVEEIFGMNKATGAYQLALAEARMAGHPIVAAVVGRAISGAFLCHGLQADRIVALDAKFGTMIHVMPLTSVSRIIKKNIEVLEELSKSNPVFAAGPQFFYQLGGVEALVPEIEGLRGAVIEQVAALRAAKAKGEATGPVGRAALGAARGGRVTRPQVAARMTAEFAAVADKYRPHA
ncbi:biotin-independent malonate decarboxylase subunit gamma [Rhodoplanes sp. TEM]|uniref:Biotin-independent malonate decarboxylase subunit gamma n=1 Tax=Rhodoplanes tepidamans TaxID=200616 RepID=A0ABT5J6A9_RHOTP|nr:MULTISPECIES: biotin-independent malonate decarboxylase subunit gamma [Rhodoplanes]MDC7784972.1 biotin-independent malonate decarboxylase subunit gamma [Rhodoplanes tepidamans]MDC7985840.1 biotin-independent malonate decarboxylase subunit gamma [Rhodoplanes sp. TEM]MDQ0353799.1 malonate decarboxylase gamma subunit [Rhodoplanes tepidamans]